jgi:TPP-dependent pyruvate/acetoin dehydrogenase alpha subunit
LNTSTGQLAAAIENAIAPDSNTRLELYRQMQACRMMEQRAHDLFMQNLIKGTTHLALGQEACVRMTTRFARIAATTTHWSEAYP